MQILKHIIKALLGLKGLLLFFMSVQRGRITWNVQEIVCICGLHSRDASPKVSKENCVLGILIMLSEKKQEGTTKWNKVQIISLLEDFSQPLFNMCCNSPRSGYRSPYSPKDFIYRIYLFIYLRHNLKISPWTTNLFPP